MKSVKKFFTICAMAATLTIGSASDAGMPGSVWTVQASPDKMPERAVQAAPEEEQAASKTPALNKTAATLIKGQTLKLTLANASGKVTWSSSDKTVATVGKTGKVTAKKKGTATITAKNGGKKYTCKITVETPKLNKTNLTIAKGEAYRLKLSGTTQTVKWSSSDRAVAKVGSATGKVSGVKAGECTITARIGKKKYSCHVEVTEEISEKEPGTGTEEFPGQETEQNQKNPEETPGQETEQSQKNPDAGSGRETGESKEKPEETQEKPVEDPEKDSGTKNTDTGAGALTEQQVYAAIMAMQAEYPEGMVWTNDNTYYWKGGIYSGGMGCAAFAFAMSDAAFGDLPARMHTDYSNIRVGDILRVNNNTHSVIVLGVSDTEVVVAEGNFNDSIHWGRRLSRAELQGEGNYILTRYPE